MKAKKFNEVLGIARKLHEDYKVSLCVYARVVRVEGEGTFKGYELLLAQEQDRFINLFNHYPSGAEEQLLYIGSIEFLDFITKKENQTDLEYIANILAQHSVKNNLADFIAVKSDIRAKHLFDLNIIPETPEEGDVKGFDLDRFSIAFNGDTIAIVSSNTGKIIGTL